MEKVKIAIVVPFSFLVSVYRRVIYERLFHRFDIRNITVGLPSDFKGIEVDVMIVSSFRNSVSEGLGEFSSSTGQLDLQKLYMTCTRSKRFLWFIGSLLTVEGAGGSQAMQIMSQYFQRQDRSYKSFESQESWKKGNIGKILLN